MELRFNGTVLNSDTDVKFNNNSIDYLKLNGTTVWEREPYTNMPYVAGASTNVNTGISKVFVSSDLTHWVEDTSASALYKVLAHSCANGIHIGMDASSADHIIYTKGGVNWKSLTMPETVYSIGSARNKLLYNGSFYVIINNYSAYKTTDFVTVTKLALPARADGERLSCVNNIFFYLNEDDGKVYKSTDCENWTVVNYAHLKYTTQSTVYSGGTLMYLPVAYYNGYYYLGDPKSTSHGFIYQKLSEDFDMLISTAGSSNNRYTNRSSYKTTQVNNRIYWETYTSSWSSSFISYFDASNDTLHDVINQAGYYSDYYEKGNGNSVFVYLNGTVYRIDENGYSAIPNPSGYCLKRITYFGRT